MLTGYTITRWFRPPEMLRAGVEDVLYDGRVDMYSLALTAYMLDTGKPLFHGTCEEILQQYDKYTPEGVYKYLVCEYNDRYTAKMLLDKFNVKPIKGCTTYREERIGAVGVFVKYMLQGYDANAKEYGYETIYDDL